MIKRKIRNNKGADQTIEFILIILLVLGIVMWILNTGIYFSNRNTILLKAQNGARFAAVMGGSGETPIYRKYGDNLTSGGVPNCGNYTKGGGTEPAECMVLRELRRDKGVINAKIESIDCGPEKTNKLGDRVYCSISWKQFNFYGKAVTHKVTASAESEVVHK